jgi:hypothetical protein
MIANVGTSRVWRDSRLRGFKLLRLHYALKVEVAGVIATFCYFENKISHKHNSIHRGSRNILFQILISLQGRHRVVKGVLNL